MIGLSRQGDFMDAKFKWGSLGLEVLDYGLVQVTRGEWMTSAEGSIHLTNLIFLYIGIA